jgi:CHASE2 domain-containing sensor protein
MRYNTITLQITGGDFVRGYTGITVPGHELIQLAASPELKSQFVLWKYTYQQITKFNSKNRGAIYHNNLDELIELENEKFKETIKKCRKESERIVNLFNEWLNSNAFSQTREQISKYFNSSGENLLIIQTECQDLWQLPWHEWNFIKMEYPNTEVVFSLYGQTSDNSNKKITIPDKARILTVFGDDEDLDLAERQKIKDISKYPDINIELLDKPNYLELTGKIRNEWDIFYYSGHTEENTFLKINRGEAEEIEGFAEAFRNSEIKIAIFNSCDNLKIASVLKEHNVSIPYSILMSEKVPDVVAAEFFECFIDKYRSGKSFYQSVKIARGKIRELERDYPCSSWLPVIVQDNIVQDNSVKLAPTWHELYLPKRKRIGVGLGIGTLATIAISLIRFIGLLQTPELFVFDTMMRSRDSQASDKHLAVIEVTSSDINQQKNRKDSQSLSNESLDRLLKILEKYKVKVVGLDNYLSWDRNTDRKKYPKLTEELEKEDGKFIVACKKEDSVNKQKSEPAPDIAQSVGFADIIVDKDQIARRQLLGIGLLENSDCNQQYSLSYLLAYKYLQDPQISESLINITQDVYPTLQIKQKSFALVGNRTGSYQNLGDDIEYQILLNYRSKISDIDRVFNVVSLQKIFDEESKGHEKELRDLIEGKIILIGTTDRGKDGHNDRFRDEVETPYGTMRGVFLQANMTSQLVNAVKESRPLIWVYPFWSEFLIIWVLSAAGGVTLSIMRNRAKIWICLGISVIIIFIIMPSSALLFLVSFGYLAPLLPAALSLLSTSIFVGLCFNHPANLKKIQNLPLTLDKSFKQT